MLNNRTSTLALLATRRSGKPREMVAPGPSPDELARILEIAARTPDHGKLFPWRLVVVPVESRDALAELLLHALAIEDAECLPAKRDAAIEFAHQAPSLVVLVSAPIAGHKIPLWEQQLSSGAVAMNLLTATTAMGYVGGWLTGWPAYSEIVRAAFCAPGERIAGFFFLGSPGRPLEERPRPAMDKISSIWSGLRTP
jgi:nitroreductase